MTTFERGLIHGLAIAAAYMARHRDEPTYAGEIITEQGYGWADLKRADVEEYDLEPLRPILCHRTIAEAEARQEVSSASREAGGRE